MSDSEPRIVVVGSLNVDHTLSVERIPSPGETVSASGALTCFGGKGANQAVAAVRAGGAVSMIGCVGIDDPGANYRRHLQSEGIDTEAIEEVAERPTGSAFIVVDQAGENTIVVNPGANHAVDRRLIEAQRDRIAASDVLLMQLECPLEVVRHAADIARQAGVRVVINPSPWQDGFADAAIPCDILIVNEGEAGSLGADSDWLQSGLARAMGVEALIVTCGSLPTRVEVRDGDSFEVPPPTVVPIDTVGAGDSFAGALAVALAEGRNLREAVAFANAAGALATLAMGAQSAIPAREAIVEQLSKS